MPASIAVTQHITGTQWWTQEVLPAVAGSCAARLLLLLLRRMNLVLMGAGMVPGCAPRPGCANMWVIIFLEIGLQLEHCISRLALIENSCKKGPELQVLRTLAGPSQEAGGQAPGVTSNVAGNI